MKQCFIPSFHFVHPLSCVVLLCIAIKRNKKIRELCLYLPEKKRLFTQQRLGDLVPSRVGAGEGRYVPPDRRVSVSLKYTIGYTFLSSVLWHFYFNFCGNLYSENHVTKFCGHNVDRIYGKYFKISLC